MEGAALVIGVLLVELLPQQRACTVGLSLVEALVEAAVADVMRVVADAPLGLFENGYLPVPDGADSVWPIHSQLPHRMGADSEQHGQIAPVATLARHSAPA